MDYTELLKAAGAAPLDEAATSDIPAGPSGSHPDDAIPESPLGLMDRAQLGWARTPREQEKLLRAQFKDVSLASTGEGGETWVVKDSDDKWKQVDPAFHWSTSATGIKVPQWDNHNAKSMLGSLAQTFGEYGPRMVAATAAGTAAVGPGMAAGAPAGPIGMLVGGAASGLAAAGLAAAGTEAADLGSRQLLQPEGAAGRTPYDKPETIQQQLLASAIFGMQDFAAGQTMKAGTQVVTKAFGSILKGLAGSPEGMATARKLMGAMGANEGLTEARMMNPTRTAGFDELARQDGLKTLQKGSLDRVEDSTFDALHQDLKSTLKREQGEFSALERNKGVQSLKLNNSELLNETVSDLKQAQLLTSNGAINEAGIVHGDGDRAALSLITRLSKNAGEMGYRDVRREVMNIGTLFENGVQNNQVRLVLSQLKTKLNGSIINGLDEETGTVYKDILNKYGMVRNISDELGSMSEGQRKYNLIGKLVNTDKRTVARDVVSSMTDAGVPMDNIEKLLQIQAAREAAPLFASKGKISKYVPILPNPNRVAAGAANAYDNASQFVKGVGSEVADSGAGQIASKANPYTAKVLSYMKSLPPEQLRQLMTSPQLFDQLAAVPYTAATNEEESKQELLKRAGIE